MLLLSRRITLLFFVFVFIRSTAAEFEGKISMVRESCFDVSYFNYFVSKNNIRIEELDAHKQIKEIYLINLSSEEIFLLQPGNEVYTKLRKNKKASSFANNFEIRKTNNSKKISGLLCYQWRVKNKERNTEFAYWVTPNDYDFFEKMVKVLNQHEINWEFFEKIPGSQGFFPMVSEERNLVRDKRMTTEVLQIKRKHIDNSLFYIPSDYKYLTM